MINILKVINIQFNEKYINYWSSWIHGRELYEKIKVKNKVYCVDDLSVTSYKASKEIKKKVQQISSSFLKEKILI